MGHRRNPEAGSVSIVNQIRADQGGKSFVHAAPFLRRLFQGEFAMENVRPVSLSVRTFQDEEPNSKSTRRKRPASLKHKEQTPGFDSGSVNLA